MTATSLSSDTRVLTGVPVVSGIGYGPVIRPDRPPAVDETGSGDEVEEAARPAEAARFATAAAAVADRLSERAQHATGAAAEVLSVTATLARDRAWLDAAEQRIMAGSSAILATAEAMAQFVDVFTRIGGTMAERVTDLQDIRDRIVAELRGLPEPGLLRPRQPSILCAEDLAPADTAGLDPSLILGVATELGGPTSHTAIIARERGIPCVVAVRGLGDVPAGTAVMLDGAHGTVTVSPDPAAAAKEMVAARRDADLLAQWTGPGATSDGHLVALLANVQDGATARAARQTPVEGVGLFRTELSFLNRDTEPSIDEQAGVYLEVLEAFAGRRVVVRTLDAGSDKLLKFVDEPERVHPALGARGVRMVAANPGLLERQLQAIAQAADMTGTSPWVMAPMIATIGEAQMFADRVRSHGLAPGVMIEIPAAALLAEKIVEHVDFLSIGTNDLAQYTMAADRMSADLAELTDPWQPAVLALVAGAAGAGAHAGKPVGVCGEAAADPSLACVLAGFGVTSLSAAATAVASVGAKLASVTHQQCRDAAEAVLATATPGAARAAALEILG